MSTTHVPSTSTMPRVSPKGDWWRYLQEARSALESAGVVTASEVDIWTYIDQIRGELDNGDSTYWEMDWQKHHPAAS